MKKLILTSLLVISSSALFADDWQKQTAPLMTPWGEQLTVEDTWTEYPRPQLVRTEWMNLNGLWKYFRRTNNIDLSYNVNPNTFSQTILVPFAPESALSGIMNKESSTNVKSTHMYRRTFTLPETYAGKRILLHFGAVDWRCRVYVNGKEAGMHQGGSDPFTMDITDCLKENGEQELQVAVYDPSNWGGQPCGKQAVSPGGIAYTATSGIWQTVWIEPVEEVYVERYEVIPDIDNSRIGVKVISNDNTALADITVREGNSQVARITKVAVGETHWISIPSAKLWSPDSPFLYDLRISLSKDGTRTDTTNGYFGMRKFSRGMANGKPCLMLNNEPLYLYGPLDQGWWPDGLLTPPSYEAMIYDLQMIKKFGMNMVRKHIKVEPDLWYEWCDRNGLVVWQDMPSGGTGGEVGTREYLLNNFYAENTNIVNALKQHPSIGAWIPFNESWGQDWANGMTHTIRGVKGVRNADDDYGRLINAVTGWYDIEMGDFEDIHSYPAPNVADNPVNERVASCGEFGGITLIDENHLWNLSDVGYTSVSNADEFVERYNQYTDRLQQLQDEKGIWASVYTQITDVENEINGLMTYDRKALKISEAQLESIRDKIVKTIHYRFMGNTVVVPSADSESGIIWRYTTSKPSGEWYSTNYDASSWKTGASGFGDGTTPHVGTNWNSSDIWLRRNFTISNLKEGDLDKLQIWMAHDEDAEIYLNGVLALSVTGYVNEYHHYPISTEALNALHTDGTDNTIAIHCKQTWGGQYIDAGIGMKNYVPNNELEVTPTPVDKAPGAQNVEGKAYLMAYSTEADKVLHYAYSTNGITWTLINGGQGITLGDNADTTTGAPYLRRANINGQDVFHLVCATSEESNGILHWQSTDLVNWTITEGTETPTITLMDGTGARPASTCMNTPEFYFESSNNTYYIYWTSLVNDKYSFYYSTTKDWKTFTTPRVYFNPGFSAQDLHIEKQGSKFYAYFYNEDQNLRRAESTTVKSANKFTNVQRMLQNESLKVRNPATYPALDDSGWFMLYNYVTNNGFALRSTSDVDNKKWRPVDLEQYSLPSGMNHCSVITITAKELRRILGTFDGKEKVLIPTAEQGKEEWKYAYSITSPRWKGKTFDDSSWATGVAGFGNGDVYHSIINCPWSEPAIYIRHKLDLTGYTEEQIKQIRGRIHCCGTAIVYINGGIALNLRTSTDNYQNVRFTDNAIDLLKADDSNVVCVVCNNNGGPQYIDLGIVMANPKDEFLFGDANSDGSVTMNDANLVVNNYVSNTDNGIDEYAADVNVDEDITMSDANGIVNIFVNE